MLGTATKQSPVVASMIGRRGLAKQWGISTELPVVVDRNASPRIGGVFPAASGLLPRWFGNSLDVTLVCGVGSGWADASVH